MMSSWKIWKSGFDRWESTTAEYLDKALQNSAFLSSSGTLLKAVLHAKSTANRVADHGWNRLGLTSRNEQDKALHRINQLESRLLDMEEEIRELREGQ
jgi:hypothetical protein